MASLAYKIDKHISKKINAKLMALSQASTTATGEKKVMEHMPELARRVAANGIVLLENDGVLPLSKSDTISIFGRCQMDTFYVGYGSGGDVKAPYYVSYYDALLEEEASGNIAINHELVNTYNLWRSKPDNEPAEGYWGHWPMSYLEMPVSKALAASAAAKSNVALVILGRAAGEDRDNKLKTGSYYLTRDEERMLDAVTSAFSKVVVIMDCGNIVDLSWIKNYGNKISALVYAWQGGMEAGHGLSDVLVGRVIPSAKLTDTIAASYKDQPTAKNFGKKAYNRYEEDIYVGYRYFETLAPDKVLYPFGYGLSYTSFTIEPISFDCTSDYLVKARVTNTGNCPGREVVQLYITAPQGKLGKAKYSLVAFVKTDELAPHESEEITLSCTNYDIASYDDSGVTGFPYAYVLEKGDYQFSIGNSIRDLTSAGAFSLEKDTCVKQLQPICAVSDTMKRIHVLEENGHLSHVMEAVPKSNYSLKDRILENLPREYRANTDATIHFSQVMDESISLDEFVAQLTEEELEALTRGYGTMNGPQGPTGNAGTFGGIHPSLEAKGIPAVTTTDGPAGVRIGAYTSSLPCGTAQASSWDPALVEELYTLVGKEMALQGSDVLLGPGMNIHRDPLCGRNFEYFSEDPLLSGAIASAFVRGIQKNAGKGACPKHFACNHQEKARNINDARVSERALREIYLKGFEVMLKECNPLCIMTSYNKINGVWSHYNYDLVTTVLREEWGYDNLVITDWWMRSAHSPEFPEMENDAYRVRAQVDVLMPGNHDRRLRGYHSNETLLPTLGKTDGITRAELQRTAKNTLTCVLQTRTK